MRTTRNDDTPVVPHSKWLAVVTYLNGDQVFISCTTQNQADSCVGKWIHAVNADDRLVQFPCSTGFANASLVSQIVRIQVAHEDVLDEWTLKAWERRKQLAQRADYQGFMAGDDIEE